MNKKTTVLKILSFFLINIFLFKNILSEEINKEKIDFYIECLKKKITSNKKIENCLSYENFLKYLIFSPNKYKKIISEIDKNNNEELFYLENQLNYPNFFENPKMLNLFSSSYDEEDSSFSNSSFKKKYNLFKEALEKMNYYNSSFAKSISKEKLDCIKNLIEENSSSLNKEETRKEIDHLVFNIETKYSEKIKKLLIQELSKKIKSN